MRAIIDIRADITQTRLDMRAAGVKRTSCFNGGLSPESYRFNARMFALETELIEAKKRCEGIADLNIS